VSRDVPTDANFQCDKVAVWGGSERDSGIIDIEVPLLRKLDQEIKNLKCKLHSKLY
jgi:hypothetical protein